MNLKMRHQHSSEWDSKNKTNWEQYLQLTFVAANSLILLATFFVGIAANSFVMLAVYKQKSLQTCNYALVVNLAVIDCLRCIIDCPVLLAINSTAYRRGHVESIVCDMQVVSFSFSCCIQLLTLACISADRYQAISQPFKACQRRRRIMVVIPLTWIVAIVVALTCLVFLKDSPVYAKCQGTENKKLQISYDLFGLYMVLPLWAVCFSIIIGFYARIFILLRSHNRKIFDKGILPALEKAKEKKEESKVVKKELNIAQVESVTQEAPKCPNKDTVAALLTPKPLPPQSISFSRGNEKGAENTLEIIELEPEQHCKEAIQGTVQGGEKSFEMEKSKPNVLEIEEKVKRSNEDGVKGSNSKLQQMSNNLNTEKTTEKKVQNDKSILETKPGENVRSSAQTNNPKSTSDLQMRPQQTDNNNVAGDQVSPITAVENTEADAGAQNQNIEGAVCMMPNKANRERANKKKESKMAKRAGYIIITFLFFWLPLITTIIVNFALNKNKNTEVLLVQELEVLSVAVACLTSLNNPIIYAAVNPQFRAEFYRLKNKVKSMYNAES